MSQVLWVESGVASGGGDHAGDVDQFAAAAVGAGGDGDDAPRPQDRCAAGEDLGEAVGQLVVVAVGEVARTAVPVMDLADLAASRPGRTDVAVDGRPVRRGRDHQRHPAVQLGRDKGGQLPGVTRHHLAGTRRALACARRMLPAASRAQRGSYSTPKPLRIAHPLARLRVGGDQVPGDGRKLLTAPASPTPRHDLAMLDAARSAGVTRLAKLSAIGTGEKVDANTTLAWHLQAEQAARSSGWPGRCYGRPRLPRTP
jgi:hypothetical protein